jgi:hypothetical protein
MSIPRNLSFLAENASSTGVLAVVGGGTGVTTSTGSGNNVLSTSPTLVTPALGTPSSGVVTNLTGTASININGTVGATTPDTGSFTSLSDSGNLTFTGTGNRITGDFSNATVASRVAFQTSTANASTSINTIPNGTSANSGINCFNAADPTNAGFGGFLIGSTEFQVRSSITGTGTYLPMTFYTGGSEAVRIGSGAASATDKGTVGIGYTALTGVGNNGLAVLGNVGIGTSSPISTLGKALHVYNNSSAGTIADNTTIKVESVNRNSVINLQGSATSTQQIQFTDASAVAYASMRADTANNTLTFFTGAPGSSAERLRINSSGDVLVTGTGTGSLGYGTGSGGTVTQATSKSTGVTLNKPTGRITMNASALAANAFAAFYCQNSLVAATDTVLTTFSLAIANDYQNYTITTAVQAGYIYFAVKNVSAGSLSEAVAFNFTIVKGATS